MIGRDRKTPPVQCIFAKLGATTAVHPSLRMGFADMDTEVRIWTHEEHIKTRTHRRGISFCIIEDVGTAACFVEAAFAGAITAYRCLQELSPQ